MKIRPTLVGDADDVIRIMNQGIAERTNAYTGTLQGAEALSWFNKLFEASDPLVVAERNDVAVGWGSLTAYRQGRGALDTVKEITFYVDNAARNIGVASMLIEFLEQKARDRGTEFLMAILLDNNDPSKNLLIKKGYELWAQFPEIVRFNDSVAGHLYMGKRLREK